MNKQQSVFASKWIFAFLFPLFCFALTGAGSASPEENTPQKLKVVYEGAHLSFYTSGRLLRQARHPKSGVWNTPARKMQEVWVKRTGEADIIRLTPQTYRDQLLELLADFPEVHGAIRYKGFTYKKLPEQARRLNEHISRVIRIRMDSARFQAK